MPSSAAFRNHIGDAEIASISCLPQSYLACQLQKTSLAFSSVSTSDDGAIRCSHIVACTSTSDPSPATATKADPALDPTIRSFGRWDPSTSVASRAGHWVVEFPAWLINEPIASCAALIGIFAGHFRCWLIYSVLWGLLLYLQKEASQSS